MARYISIDNAIKIATKAMEFGDYNKLIAVSNALYEAPAADVVEVVRCKDCVSSRPLNRKDRFENAYDIDCVYCMLNGDGRDRDGFCSYGERKE